MKTIGIALLSAVALSAAQPAWAQESRRIDFRGNPASESATAVAVTGLEALRGARSVVIPQFTVEFVERSSGLSAKQVRRQDSIEVNYKVVALGDAERQSITNQLYSRWVAGLKAQGLQVFGPRDAMAKASWAKLAKNSRPAPELIARGETLSRIYSVEGSPFLMPAGAAAAPAGGATGTALGAADTGAAVASKVGGRALGRVGGMFGMARSLGKMGSSLGNFGGTWNYAAAEPALATEMNAAVMTVRLVVDVRETDMASRGLGLFRTAGSYKGKPKLVINESTQVTVTPPVANRKGTRATLGVPADLVFQEDIFAGKLVADNSTGQNVANVANRALFVGAAIAGGSGAVNQRYNFNLTPETAAYSAAVTRNLSAIEDIFLARLATAW